MPLCVCVCVGAYSTNLQKKTKIEEQHVSNKMLRKNNNVFYISDLHSSQRIRGIRGKFWRGNEAK